MSLSEALSVPGGSDGKASAYNAGDPGSIPGLGRSPREGMATHSSILAWKIPYTEEPGGLQSKGLQRVRHDWAQDTATQHSLPPLHWTSNIIPSSFFFFLSPSSFLIVSFQNTKTDGAHFPVLFPVHVLKKQRSFSLLHFQPSELADLDRLKIRWTCSLFWQMNYPHYHLM